MDQTDMRNQILSELIDKMHGRMADAAYPEEKAPVEEEIASTVEPKDEKLDKMSPEDDEMSDDDLSELMKMSGE